MATNSGWTTLMPSATSSVALGDDELRSIKSFMEVWWEQEHYATDGSTSSAGVHKTGSARAFSAAAQPTGVAPAGQLWHDTDDDKLRVFNGSAWTLVGDGRIKDTANTWSSVQTLSAGVAVGSGGLFKSLYTYEIAFKEDNNNVPAQGSLTTSFTTGAAAFGDTVYLGPESAHPDANLSWLGWSSNTGLVFQLHNHTSSIISYVAGGGTDELKMIVVQLKQNQ